MILVLLQAAVGLLANPAIQTDLALRSQANQFAAQAMSLAQQVIQEQMGTSTPIVAATTLPTIVIPTSTQATAPAPVYVYVPYVPPTPVQQPVSQPVFQAAPLTPPTFPTIPWQTNTSSTATLTFRGGDYDSLQITLYQPYTDTAPITFDVTSNPFTLTGLPAKTSYSCYLTATKNGIMATTSILGYTGWSGQLIPQRCDTATSYQ